MLPLGLPRSLLFGANVVLCVVTLQCKVFITGFAASAVVLTASSSSTIFSADIEHINVL